MNEPTTPKTKAREFEEDIDLHFPIHKTDL